MYPADRPERAHAVRFVISALTPAGSVPRALPPFGPWWGRNSGSIASVTRTVDHYSPSLFEKKPQHNPYAKKYTSAVAVFFRCWRPHGPERWNRCREEAVDADPPHRQHRSWTRTAYVIWQDVSPTLPRGPAGQRWLRELDWRSAPGPSGSAAIVPINSTTAANGYGMVDSDHGNSGTNYEQSHMTNADGLSDQTGHPNVVLEFGLLPQIGRTRSVRVVQTSNTGWPVLDPATGHQRDGRTKCGRHGHPSL